MDLDGVGKPIYYMNTMGKCSLTFIHNYLIEIVTLNHAIVEIICIRYSIFVQTNNYSQIIK